MNLKNGSDFKSERAESDFLNKIWFDFGGFSSIQEYAYACYEAIYGKVDYYDKKEHELIDGYFSPSGTFIRSEQEHEKAREYFLLIQNVFHGFIYQVSYLPDPVREIIAAKLSNTDFYKKCESIKDVEKAFSAFIGIYHPPEEWYLPVGASSLKDKFVRAMFYGAFAALLWRTIHNEVNHINALPSIRGAVGNIGEALEAVISKMNGTTPYDELNALNKEYLPALEHYKKALHELTYKYEGDNYDASAGAFDNKRGSDSARLFLADLLFCLRKKIAATYVADRRSPTEDRQALGKKQWAVLPEACSDSLQNGLDVAFHLSGVLENSKRKKDENIKKYIIDNMVVRIVEDSMHDHVNDAGGGISKLMLMNQGAFYIYWGNEVKANLHGAHESSVYDASDEDDDRPIGIIGILNGG